MNGDARMVMITNATSNCDYDVSLQAKGGQCVAPPSDMKTATLEPGDSISFQSSDFGSCFAGKSGQNPDLSNIKGTATGTARNSGDNEECPTTMPNVYEWNGIEFVLEDESGDENWANLGISNVLATAFKDNDPTEPIEATFTNGPYCVDVQVNAAGGEVDSLSNVKPGATETVSSGPDNRSTRAISNIRFTCVPYE